MPDPFLGEMRLFAGNFAPDGWAFCEGQLLSVDANQPLHTLIGNTYGGDGSTTFALPDLRGRVPVGAGQAPGLSGYALGQQCGTETVTLTEASLPAHSHRLNASSVSAAAHSPERAAFGAAAANVLVYPDSNKPTVAPRAFSPDMVSSVTGDPQPHENMMPTTAIHTIIALDGIYPTA